MFQQRERELQVPQGGRKKYMFYVLKHFMDQEGLSIDTKRSIWVDAKMHNRRINNGA